MLNMVKWKRRWMNLKGIYINTTYGCMSRQLLCSIQHYSWICKYSTGAEGPKYPTLAEYVNIVQEQRVQHLSTCLELLRGVS